ncbi:phytanoyl-CoA dioxygenase family protein [Paraburkholderia sp. BCC1884]|uniref:phytanoyl-CoA dioxygenase family protein n=1 Tax=Paraburkholderia sp. BCC1884 TaxID=2562668 RepID=UPI001182F943|nr:phytanoyl-CoA dioxygenase family protein [Paraburkholderia sp. BCC1884]
MHGERFYGDQRPVSVLDDPIAYHLEELCSLGYTVINDVLPGSELDDWRKRIDAVYERQELEVGGRDALIAIGDQDICRAPLLYDQTFLSMARHQKVLAVISRIFGDSFILNLQNAIINRPNERHQQSAWHRDLPYQNWVASRPLAIGALFAIDPFSEETGSTLMLAHSHRRESIPSEAYIRTHAATVTARPGSVVMFDAMVFHRAGYNRSPQIRRGVNHLYTVPILKQQYDFTRALGDVFREDAELRRLLGYTSTVPIDVLQWRRERQTRKTAR